jgi:arginase family enzyme
LCKEVCLNKLIRILRGFERLNAVGADIVEVAPAYNGVG